MSYLESCRGVFKSNRILTIYALYIFDTIMFFTRTEILMVYKNNRAIIRAVEI